MTVERAQLAQGVGRGGWSRVRMPGLGQRIRKALPLYLALLPTFALLLVFLYYPAFLAILRSFYKWDIGLPAEFVGLNNFVRMLDDRVFLLSLKNISYITIWLMFHATVIPLIVAEMIFAVRSARWSIWLRVGMVLPAIIPSVVTYLVWRQIYDGSTGLLNVILSGIGLDSWSRVWLGDPNTAIWAIIFSGFPWINGVNTLITLAGLQAINPEMLEASQLDGAGTLQRIRYVDMHLVVGQIKLNLVRAVIGAVQMFEIVFIMTNGGPFKRTMVPALWLYRNGFEYHRMGYASAIGVVLFVVILLLTIINLKVLSERSA